MKPAEIKLQSELEQTAFEDLKVPVISNFEAKPVTRGRDARQALVRQVCSPVRWLETMQYMVAQGIEVMVEIGSGKVLSGLMKRFNKNVSCYQVSDPKSLQQAVAALKG